MTLIMTEYLHETDVAGAIRTSSSLMIRAADGLLIVELGITTICEGLAELLNGSSSNCILFPLL